MDWRILDSIEETIMPTRTITPNTEAGFTLVEAMLAMLILAGGLLALASAFAQGMLIMSTAHYHQIAKEKASEAIESVFTSRDTGSLAWNAVRNQNQGGLFLDGEQPICEPGADGLVNTSDDGNVESATFPGPDNLMGTGDDATTTLSNFTREIAINNIGTNLREIRVTIRYSIGHLRRQYQLVSYISPFA